MADSSHSVSAYYKRAVSPLVTLRLLQERPMYGYEIAQAIKERSDGHFSISLLYPVLYRLEEQGYIYVAHTDIVENRVRNYYAVTSAGKAHYEQAIKEYYQIHTAFWGIVEGNGSDEKFVSGLSSASGE